MVFFINNVSVRGGFCFCWGVAVVLSFGSEVSVVGGGVGG